MHNQWKTQHRHSSFARLVLQDQKQDKTGLYMPIALQERNI